MRMVVSSTTITTIVGLRFAAPEKTMPSMRDKSRSSNKTFPHSITLFLAWRNGSGSVAGTDPYAVHVLSAFIVSLATGVIPSFGPCFFIASINKVLNS